jgi:hypothetical protein
MSRRTASSPKVHLLEHHHQQQLLQDWEVELLQSASHAVSIYANATGSLNCFDPAAATNEESGADLGAWNYQVNTILKNCSVTAAFVTVEIVLVWHVASSCCRLLLLVRSRRLTLVRG